MNRVDGEMAWILRKQLWSKKYKQWHHMEGRPIVIPDEIAEQIILKIKEMKTK